MTMAGDYPDEMFRRTDLTDDAIEQLLTGCPAAGHEALAAFAEEVRAASAEVLPEPSAALATAFAEGLSVETIEAPAHRAPAPKRRTKRMIEVLLAKLAAAGLLAKAGLAAGAITLGATAAAATGAVDIPDLPGGGSDEHRVDANHRGGVNEAEEADVNEDTDDSDDAGNEAETPEQADFGKSVSDEAQNGDLEGREFGEWVSTEAQQRAATQGQRPAETPTADNNPGTEHRDGAGSQQPEETPTADDNPGTEYRDGAGSQQPENPGAGRRP